ncbi:MAG: hypothetical protein ABIL06_21710 [Pseudomonadota bacterium]
MTQMTNEKELKLMERDSIELDICIDEKNEDKCNEIAKFVKDEDLKNLIECKKEDFGTEVVKVLEKIKINEDKERDPSDDFWHAFFLAKRLRASLQCKNNDEYSDKLDWVVDFLIKKGAPDIKENDSTSSFKYLHLLLELAACTTGEQSLGFSEKARIVLDEIKIAPFENWYKTAYEALIHYHQGVAKQHMAQYDAAREEYDKAIHKCNDEKIKSKDEDQLWRNYVYNPAILQKAETLIKMPFAYNALETLETINDGNNVMQLHKTRRDLLKATCYIELGDRKKFEDQWRQIERHILSYDSIVSPIKEINGEIDFLCLKEPFKSEKIPFTITSQSNSLILAGAKEQLEKEISKKIKNKSFAPEVLKKNSKELLRKVNDNVINFFKCYLEQSKNNRFDRLTIEETICNYLGIIADIWEEGLLFKESKLREPIMELFDLLSEYFIEDMDTKKNLRFILTR